MASKKKNVVKASKQNLHIVALPAHWANYLINGDETGLTGYHNESLDDVHACLKAHGVFDAHCVDVQAEYLAKDSFTGILTDLAEFVFVPAKH